MGEKTPDTDESGIERRNVLKGLGFGAMGLAGVGAMSSGAIAQPRNVGLTPPDEDLEDNRLTGSPPTIPSGMNTVDLVAYHGMGDDKPIGTKLTILTRGSPPQVVTQSFEEGTAECSTGLKGSDPSGNVEIRKNFSVETLSSGQYVAVLTIMDYSGVSSPGGTNLGNGASTMNSDIATIIAQSFDK